MKQVMGNVGKKYFEDERADKLAAGSYPGRSNFLSELTWNRTLLELITGYASNH